MITCINDQACCFATQVTNLLSYVVSTAGVQYAWVNDMYVWMAWMPMGGTTIDLGRYLSEEDAARAHDM